MEKIDLSGHFGVPARFFADFHCIGFPHFLQMSQNRTPATLSEPPTACGGLLLGSPFRVFFRCYSKSLESEKALKVWQAWPKSLSG